MSQQIKRDLLPIAWIIAKTERYSYGPLQECKK